MFRVALVLASLVLAASNCRPAGQRPPIPSGRPRSGCEPVHDGLGSLVFHARVDTPEAHRAHLKHDLAQYDRCACDSTDPAAMCGPFPCAASGCYVQVCDADDDCAVGRCGVHRSPPEAYCVSSDP